MARSLNWRITEAISFVVIASSALSTLSRSGLGGSRRTAWSPRSPNRCVGRDDRGDGREERLVVIEDVLRDHEDANRHNPTNDRALGRLAGRGDDARCGTHSGIVAQPRGGQLTVPWSSATTARTFGMLALSYAARRVGSDGLVIVVHAYAPPADADPDTRRRIAEERRVGGRELLGQAVARCREFATGASCETDLKEGGPAEALLAVSRRTGCRRDRGRFARIGGIVDSNWERVTGSSGQRGPACGRSAVR